MTTITVSTRRIVPTDTDGASLVVSSPKGSITIPWDYASLDMYEQGARLLLSNLSVDVSRFRVGDVRSNGVLYLVDLEEA